MRSVNFAVAAAAVVAPMTNSLGVVWAAVADWHSADRAQQSNDAVTGATVESDLRFAAAVAAAAAAAAAVAAEFVTICYCFDWLGLVAASAIHFAATACDLLGSVGNCGATCHHRALE